MNKLHELLENCINALEHGESIERTLSRYGDRKEELRPLLAAVLKARQLRVPAPTAELIRRGRANLLQKAAQMRTGKAKSIEGLKYHHGVRRIPAFQRLALAITLVVTFFLSGNGLVRAASGALPGEELYSVKRTWEDLRLFMAFDQEQREALAGAFDEERLDEVDKLLTEGRQAQIRIAGTYGEINGLVYVSGIRVLVTSATELPETKIQSGMPVVVKGWTNPNGYVEAVSVELLPAGSVVPAGQVIPVGEEIDENLAPDTESAEETDSSLMEESGESEDEDQSESGGGTQEDSEIDNSGSGSSQDDSGGNAGVDNEDNNGRDGDDGGEGGAGGDNSGSGGGNEKDGDD